jgi:electron transfer flavoprotein beta subunit
MQEGINIVVCMKYVPDPDGPPSCFSVDEEKKEVTVTGIPPVLSPYDENSLEAALRIKDDHGGRITVVSMGRKLAKPVAIKALASGADDMVLIQDDSNEYSDSFSTAFGLSAAIKKIGEPDLILCGRQASDSNGGQVGVGVAEILGIPSVSFVHKVEIRDGKLRVERLLSDGYEVLESDLPALVTLSSELYELRHTSIAGMMEAKKKPLKTWSAADVGLDITKERRMNLVSLTPRVSDTTCEIIGGESPEEAGGNLAQKLIEANVI